MKNHALESVNVVIMHYWPLTFGHEGAKPCRHTGFQVLGGPQPQCGNKHVIELCSKYIENLCWASLDDDF